MQLRPEFVFFSGHEHPNRLNIAVLDLSNTQQQEIEQAVGHPSKDHWYDIKDNTFRVFYHNNQYVFDITHLLPKTQWAEIALVFANTTPTGIVPVDNRVFVAFFRLTNTQNALQ